MRVGLDARRLRAGRGLDRYVCELVSAFARCEAGPDLLLFMQEQPIPPYVQIPRNSRMEPASRRLRALYRCGLGWWGSHWFRDLDLVHFPTSDVWYSRYCRTVVTLHDLIPLKHPDWFFDTREEERRYLRHLQFVRDNACLLMTETEYTRRDLQRLLGVPADRVLVSCLGVDTERFQPMAEEKARAWLNDRFPVPDRYLLFVGAIEPKKNVRGIVEAYLRLRQDVHLILVGSVPPRWRSYAASIERMVEAAGAQHRVHFRGPVQEDRTLRALYAGAVGFVFPSIEEGFGMPPLEAMACGAAVITSSTTSLPEVVGDAAVQVQPEDTDGLAAAMGRLLDDRDYRNELACRGPDQARCFPWSRVATLTLEGYRRALAS